MQVLAAEKTRGLTSTLTLDSAINNYLFVSAKIEKDLEKKTKSAILPDNRLLEMYKEEKRRQGREEVIFCHLF